MGGVFVDGAVPVTVVLDEAVVLIGGDGGGVITPVKITFTASVASADVYASVVCSNTLTKHLDA